MGVPYEAKPMAGIEVDSVPVVVEVPWPNRSVISKIIVVQTDGVQEAFTVALYNHPQVQTGEVTSDSVGPDIGRLPDDVYRVTPNLVASSGGKLIYFSDQATGGYGYVFFSQKDLAGRQGQKESKLYVKITPVSAGVKSIALCIGGQKEVE